MTQLDPKELYSMKLGDTLNVGPSLQILRVPGGWIYYHIYYHTNWGQEVGSTFVPFNNEFQPLIFTETSTPVGTTADDPESTPYGC